MSRLGPEGEEMALGYLKRLGYRIYERNYRTPFGEIDIIAGDGEIVVFVEVKTRANYGYGAPFESVTKTKREKIRKTALSYLKRLKAEPPARFDVLSISVSGGEERIEHIRDAFEV